MFGAFHPAEGDTRAPGVLICGPYGQEAVRAHRMLRVLADRLSRSGCDVLRFDPYGSGDASGDDIELSLPGWSADVLLASEELRRRSSAREQVWVGARLGGTAACLAACLAHRPPASLVLCEPVLEGAAYLTSLAQATVQTLEASCSIRDALWRATLQSDPERWEREAVGFSMGEALHRQLQALQPDGVQVPKGTRVALLSSGSGGTFEAQARRWREQGALATHEALDFPFDWTAEEALNTALVPHEMLQRLAERALQEVGAAQPERAA
ncbi:MAG: alpha/beta hydrolase [Rubrivivax sp.]|nr:alpha/beta hydrolase [Rubrivivax sp.]